MSSSSAHALCLCTGPTRLCLWWQKTDSISSPVLSISRSLGDTSLLHIYNSSYWGNRGLVGDMGICVLHSLFLLSPRIGGNRRDPQKGVITKTTGANCSRFFLGKGDSFRLASLISGLDWKSQEKPPPSQILPNTAGKGSGLSEKRSITLFTTSFLSF